MRTAILAVCCLATLAAAQNPDTLWVRTYGYESLPMGIKFGWDLVVTDDNRLFVAGNIHPTFSGHFTLREYTLDGELVWSETLVTKGPMCNVRGLEAVCSPTGYILVAAAGYEQPPLHTFRQYVFARELNGELRWCHVYESYRTYWNIGIAADHRSHSYFCGPTRTDNGGIDYLTAKYDSSGGVVWERVFDGPKHCADKARGVAVDSSGHVYVVGSTEDSSTMEKPTIVCYSPSGELVWSDRLCAEEPLYGSFTDVAVGPDGCIYVLGPDCSGAAAPSPLAKYTVEGDTVWTRRLPGRAKSLALDPWGYLGITGRLLGEENIKTWRISPEGQVLWERTYDGPAHLTDSANAVTFDRHGNIIVAGYSSDSTEPEVGSSLVLCYSQRGDLLREERFLPEGRSVAWVSALGTDSAGCIYATGTASTTVSDWVTMKLPAIPSALVSPKQVDLDLPPVGAQPVHGMLAHDGRIPGFLIDITGRKSMDLLPGENDIRHVAPGVYFVVTPSPLPSPPQGERMKERGVRTAERGKRPAVRKVIVTK